VRFPSDDADAASVTYLRDFDLIARAVDAQLAPLPRQPSGATDRVGPAFAQRAPAPPRTSFS